ncbi:histamine H1 receptor isoform X2 [Brienomyrus brachyistius]|uniref:histamine H1 receptor isoform X2 n=1 Tax=Brienomyrus brachyistius TaxID=42636 RepID=UPI0020B3E8FB|nr:histamine H1 receptor isoform X2 [Brienomyrus brachyistius]
MARRQRSCISLTPQSLTPAPTGQGLFGLHHTSPCIITVCTSSFRHARGYRPHWRGHRGRLHRSPAWFSRRASSRNFGSPELFLPPANHRTPCEDSTARVLMEPIPGHLLTDNYVKDAAENQTGAGAQIHSGLTGSLNLHVNNVLLGIFLGTVSLLTVVMNVLVLYAVKKERTLHTVGNLYIVSLSVADLIVGATVMPLNLIYLLEDEWRLGHIVCQFWLVMDYVASTASIFSLFILCLDRYRSVLRPLQYLQYRTRGRAILMIAGAWLLSMTWIIPILGWRFFSDSNPKPETENKCDTDFRFVTWFKVLTAILNFYVPSLLMLWFYMRIYMVVRQHYRQRQCIQKLKNSIKRHGITQKRKLSRKSLKFNPAKTERSTPPDYSNVDDLLDQYSLGQPCYSKDMDGDAQTDVAWSEKKINKCCYQTSLFTVPKHLKKSVKDTEKHVPSSSCLAEEQVPETPLRLSSLPLGILQSDDDKVPKMFVSVNDCNLSSPNSVSGVCEITHMSDVQRYAAVVCHGDFHHPVASPWPPGTDLKLDSTNVQTLKQSWQKFCTQSKQCIQNLRAYKERKAAKQLGFIIAAFLVCWIPYFVTFMVMAFCKTCIHHDLHMFTIWLGYFNSTLNPFIYPLCNENFKRVFKSLLHMQ